MAGKTSFWQNWRADWAAGLKRLGLWQIVLVLALMAPDMWMSVTQPGGTNPAAAPLTGQANSAPNTNFVIGDRIKPTTLSQVKRLSLWKNDKVSFMAVSPDGKRYAVGANDGLYLFDAQSGEQIAFTQTESYPTSVVYTSDGKNILCGAGSGVLYNFRAGDGVLVSTYSEHISNIRSLAASPINDWLASGDVGGSVRLWLTSPISVYTTFDEQSEEITALAFAPRSHLLASASKDRSLKLIDTSLGQVVGSSLSNDSWPVSLAFSPDGTLLAVGRSSKDIALYKVQSGVMQQITTLTPLADIPQVLAFSPDGGVLAVGEDNGDIVLWPMNADEPDYAHKERTLSQHKGRISSLTFLNFSDTLIASSWDGSVSTWGVPQK